MGHGDNSWIFWDGWRQLILSNHVPELASIVRALGIDQYLDAVISSAFVGYEKPHPAAYAAAMDIAGSPLRAWMIGDSLEADALGADRVGLAAILVGGAPRRWTPAAATLRELLDLVGEP